MGSSLLRKVTINFLGVRVPVQFRAGKYDYAGRIPLEQARECYNAALGKLTSDSVPFGFNIQISVGVVASGKVCQVTLFRYVKNGTNEDVQCMLNLRFGTSGSAEISVTYTTFGLMVEPDDYGAVPDKKPREVTLWKD
jgi:hypothetical protein